MPPAASPLAGLPEDTEAAPPIALSPGAAAPTDHAPPAGAAAAVASRTDSAPPAEADPERLLAALVAQLDASAPGRDEAAPAPAEQAPAGPDRPTADEAAALTDPLLQAIAAELRTGGATPAPAEGPAAQDAQSGPAVAAPQPQATPLLLVDPARLPADAPTAALPVFSSRRRRDAG
jgi:hypothetical protein